MSPCELCGGIGNFCSNCDFYNGEYIKKSVLKDIKAEIASKEVEVEFMNDWRCGYNSAIYDSMRVIDNHISGKEQTE